MIRWRTLSAGTVALLTALAIAGSEAGGGTPPRVTLIGDSVAESIAYTPDAKSLLAEGVDLRLELAACRRVDQASCPYNGVRPPTVIDLVKTLGNALGPTVIVDVGYNDFEPAYAGNIEDALAALHKADVTRVLWATLRADRPEYLSMNNAIRAAAARHPEMTTVDWNLYSRSHPDWFQGDGLHLTAGGAMALATLFHTKLVELGISAAPPPVAIVSSTLAQGHVGQPYAKTLVARGGTKPYRWRRTLGHFPVGLRLLADGRLSGAPRVAGSYTPTVRVTDARGGFATRRLTLRIRSA